MENLNELDLCLYWYDRSLYGSEFLIQSKGYLSLLRQKFEKFKHLYIVDHSGQSTEPIRDDFEGFDNQVGANLPTEWLYSNPNPSVKHFTPACTCKMGFSSWFSTAPFGDQAAGVIELSIGKAARNATNYVIIKFPKKEPPDAPDFYIEFFKENIQYWNPRHGVLSRGRYDDILDQPFSEMRLGLITYLPNIDVSNHLSSEFKYELFADGLIVKIMEYLPGASDSTVIPLLRKLHLSLQGTGLLRI